MTKQVRERFPTDRHPQIIGMRPVDLQPLAGAMNLLEERLLRGSFRPPGAESSLQRA